MGGSPGKPTESSEASHSTSRRERTATLRNYLLFAKKTLPSCCCLFHASFLLSSHCAPQVQQNLDRSSEAHLSQVSGQRSAPCPSNPL